MAERRGGDAEVFAKMQGERALIGETAGESDFRQRLVALAQSTAGGEQAGFDKELLGTNAKDGDKFSLELAEREACEAGEVGDSNLFLVIFANMGHRFRDTAERGE